MVALGLHEPLIEQWRGPGKGMGAVGEGRKRALGRSKSLGLQVAGTGRLNLASIWEHPAEEETRHKELRFGEMVGMLSQWFAQWSECERAVMLYSLVKQLPASQCCFLQTLLDHAACCSPRATSGTQASPGSPTSPATTDTTVGGLPPLAAPATGSNEQLNSLQQRANSAEHVLSLKSLPLESTVQQLLANMPLLRPEHSAAKDAYLNVIKEVLQHAMKNLQYLEGSKQLLSFALIHPAVTSDERRSLSSWLPVLEKYTNNGQPDELPAEERLRTERSHQPLHSTVSLQPQHASSQALGDRLTSYRQPRHLPLQPTVSAPPGFGAKGSPERRFARPQRAITDWLQSGERLAGSPESSNNSGSDTDQKQQQVVALQPCGKGPGMKEMFSWLRQLRLHKYAKIFADMTYEDMMKVDEETLEKHGVTKGARNKWTQSIQKLQERQETLRRLQQEVKKSASTKNALIELHNILNTPIKPFEHPVAETGSTAQELQIPEADEDCFKINSDSLSSKTESEQLADSCKQKHDASVENSKKTAVSSVSALNGSAVHRLVSDPENVAIANGDIPGEFTKTMGRVSQQLLMAPKADEDCNSCFLKLVNQCCQHEAFTVDQRGLLEKWKVSIQKLWGIHPPRHKFLDRELQHKFGLSVGPSWGLAVRTPVVRSASGPYGRSGYSQTHHHNGHRPLVRKSSLTPPVYGSSLASDLGAGGKQSLSRTRSEPMPQQLRPLTKQLETSDAGKAMDS